ncbi:carbohydrate ABC transporter permease [Streptomyces sp. NPDC056716]|uniref:carbohydrate ABC transporter permease n=1 Tax=unclassified Streptomyces TaxID=2593676 RepID=UPI0036C5D40F
MRKRPLSSPPVPPPAARPAPARPVAGPATTPGDRPRPGGPGGLRTRLRRADRTLAPYLYIAPFFLLFLGFGLFPLGYTLFVSLHDWSLLGAEGHRWVGLANYRELLGDSYFWNALMNTVSIWLLSTVPQLLLALALAHTLNIRMRARTTFRMGVLLPNVASVAAVAIIFTQLFGRDFGMVNWALDLVGIGPVDWQGGRVSSHVAVSAMVIWRWTGYNALIYLAAMQTIPRERYEAARTDGANGLQLFRHITVPALRPVIIFTVVISTIQGLQLFAEPLLFDPTPGGVTGGSDRQFQTLTVYLYEQGFRQFDFGYASTIAWVMFLVIVVASAVNYLITRRIRSSG